MRNASPKRSTGLGRLIRPLLSILILIVVAGASAMTTWLWATKAPATTASATAPDGAAAPVNIPPAAPPAAPIFLALDPFTVSLENAEMERMVHLRLTLRVDDQEASDRLTRYMPEVRDRVLMLLSAKSPAAITSIEGKRALANSIKESLAQPFAPLTQTQSIRDVLFTEFVVQ